MPMEWEQCELFFVEAVHEICKRMGGDEGTEHLEKLSRRHQKLQDAICELAWQP